MILLKIEEGEQRSEMLNIVILERLISISNVGTFKFEDQA